MLNLDKDQDENNFEADDGDEEFSEEEGKK